MPVRELRQAGSTHTANKTTVCIVGAGVAGLVAAARLTRQRGVQVAILESGVTHDDPAMLALERIENPAGNYSGTFRSRGLGGTSVKWAGKLLPISTGDTRPRPWLDVPGWPFDLTELDRYRPEIETMMGVDGESYEEDAARLLDPRALLPRGDSDFTVRWPKRPTSANHNLAHVLRHEIESRSNLNIWLGATVSRFRFDSTSGRLASIEATNHHGQSIVVEAEEFLIAAGTLESTRLMLLADRQSGGRISREGDSLGRHFNDHLGLNVASLEPVERTRTNRLFADRWLLGGDRHLHFELQPTVQENERVASAYFDIAIEVPETSGLTQTRRALQALKHRQLGNAFSSGLKALADAPSLVGTAKWQVVDKTKFWPSNALLNIKVWVEQLPHWKNRIVLSDSLDTLGQPLMKFDYHKTDDEERAFRASCAHIRTYWSRHFQSVCRLKWLTPATDTGVRLVDESIELAHPAGSTRMGTAAANSVVDGQLHVHTITNLSVASASVFPSSGSANPTFTIMQLAMRAADAIAARVVRSKAA